MEILNIITGITNFCFMIIGVWVGVSFLVDKVIQKFCKHQYTTQTNWRNHSTREIYSTRYCKSCGKKLIPSDYNFED